jgi:hypothetical protein
MHRRNERVRSRDISAHDLDIATETPRGGNGIPGKHANRLAASSQPLRDKQAGAPRAADDENPS